MFQPASRAAAIGSTDSRQETWTTYSGEPATRASWIARFVASPSVSGGRVSAWYFGSVFPAASASFTSTSIASPFSACTITSAPGLRRDLHRAEERLVVDHERALVGHEELVRRDALIRQRRQLLERAAVLQVGDRHVVAHVDHLLAFRLRLPLVDRVGEGRALRLDD
jgi:hypothetical protein